MDNNHFRLVTTKWESQAMHWYYKQNMQNKTFGNFNHEIST